MYGPVIRAHCPRDSLHYSAGGDRGSMGGLALSATCLPWGVFSWGHSWAFKEFDTRKVLRDS